MYLRNHYYRVATIFHAAAEFSLSTVTVNAEKEDGPVPGARVTWSTTTPSECVTSVQVEFRNSSRGSVEKSCNVTDTSQTEVIQTGLKGNTMYYIRVVVAAGDGEFSLGTLMSEEVQVLTGGKVTAFNNTLFRKPA